MKKIAITILLVALLTAIGFSVLPEKGPEKKQLSAFPGKKESGQESGHLLPPALIEKLNLKATNAKAFAQKKNFNTAFCFLIDMSLPSYQKRFFIYDLQKDSVVKSGLVTHGNCNQYWLEGRKFDNTVGCGCTSLGKYKVGNSYMGRFGLAFKLYGLESTNDKAFVRYVVLHSHSCVPETEIETDICQSNGCPTVSPGFLKELEPVIKGSGNPVLLWIFN
jgi:hypothetical protein